MASGSWRLVCNKILYNSRATVVEDKTLRIINLKIMMSMKNWSLVLIIGISVIFGCLITEGRTAAVQVLKNFELSGRCEPIKINLCSRLPYNETVIPNSFDHQNQDDASLEINQFAPLVKVNCSPDFRAFLCAMYVPVCTVLEKPLPPCRSICERAKAGCEPIMRNFGFQWPSKFECSKLPVYGDPDNLCVEFSVNSESSSNKSPSHDFINGTKNVSSSILESSTSATIFN